MGPVTWPLRNPSGKALQVYVTQYMINTALISAYDTGNTLDITMLLQKLNLTVTTDEIGVVIPELLTKYGSGKAVQISAAFMKKATSISADAKGLVVNDLNLAVTLKVGTETAIQAEFDGAAAAGILTAKTSDFFGSISKASIGTVNVSNFKTTLGMDAAAFQKELQEIIDPIIASLNSKLTAGIPIPTVKGINFSDLALNWNTGYLEVGINAMPAHFLALQDAWGAFKLEHELIRSGHYKTEKFILEEIEELLDVDCRALYKEKSSCDANAACSWCTSFAVADACNTLEDAKHLPPSVFTCDKVSGEFEKFLQW